MQPAELAGRVLTGDRRALARLLTLVEDGGGTGLSEALARLHGRTGRAHVVGVTGAPGVGKSTLADGLVRGWRGGGLSVAVLAVDPSSSLTGGALLGDRARMQDHAADAGVFVRSMANRGHAGGLSAVAPVAVHVLDAAGFDVVLVETVGVGQAEVEVAGVADTVLVVLAPGLGDRLQASKAGLLEVADVLVVNKADRPGADAVVADLRDMQGVAEAAGEERGWRPPIVRTTAPSGAGLGELTAAVDAHRAWLDDSGRRCRRRVRRTAALLRALVQARLHARATAAADAARVEALARVVVRGELDPDAAASRLLAERGV